MSHWSLIEADLADRGIDVGDEALMRARSWRWLRTRIVGLLTVPVTHDFAGDPVFATRLQAELMTPAPDQLKRQEG